MKTDLLYVDLRLDRSGYTATFVRTDDRKPGIHVFERRYKLDTPAKLQAVNRLVQRTTHLSYWACPSSATITAFAPFHFAHFTIDNVVGVADNGALIFDRS